MKLGIINEVVEESFGKGGEMQLFGNKKTSNYKLML